MNMRNNLNQKQVNEQSISRYQLKEKLNGMEKVDISSFDQSKNQMSKYNYSPIQSQANSIFPSVDAPTLQFFNQQQKKVNKAQKFQQGQKRKYYEDPTQRNKKSRQKQLQQENKVLKIKLQEKQRQLIELMYNSQQKQLLKQKIKHLQTQTKKKQQQIIEQKEQIKMLKDREIRIAKEKDQVLREYNNFTNNHSTVSGVTSSYYIEDVSSFCPEMLSPQETVLLLSKLLKKVSKSSKMIRELTQQGSVKQILGKMTKR